MSATCKYGLARKTVGADRVGRTMVVECGEPATTHVDGHGVVPRGIDQQGNVGVHIIGDYCTRHARTVITRLTSHTATPIKENA